MSEPLFVLLFSIHLVAFVGLFIKTRKVRYLRVCAIFAALIGYYALGWADVDVDLGVTSLRMVFRITAWVLAVISAWFLVGRLIEKWRQ